jgi:hypothetical protein
MPFKNKKELQRLWESIEPTFVAQLSKNLELTGTDYSVGNNPEPNLGIELNKKWAFFIFNEDESSISLYSHERLPIDIMENVIRIKSVLMNIVFPKQVKHAKALKAE